MPGVPERHRAGDEGEAQMATPRRASDFRHGGRPAFELGLAQCLGVRPVIPDGIVQRPS